MIFTVRTQEKYFWKFDNNLDLPEEERGYAIISLPSMLDAQNAVSNGYTGAAEFEFVLHVSEIGNYQIKDGEKIKEATPVDIWRTKGLSELANELKEKYKEYTNIDKKKLKSGSGSNGKA